MATTARNDARVCSIIAPCDHASVPARVLDSRMLGGAQRSLVQLPAARLTALRALAAAPRAMPSVEPAVATVTAAAAPAPSARPKVLILTGPTAVGKTRASLALAEALGGEIISADSVQVYRGLDIGSDKVRCGR